MPKDYANSRVTRGKPKTRSFKRKSPPWVWLLAGLAIGLFVNMLFYLKNQTSNLLHSHAQTNETEPDEIGKLVASASKARAPSKQDAPKHPTKVTATKTTTTQKPAEDKKLHFDFYTVLPKGDAKSSAGAPATPANADAAAASTSADNAKPIQPLDNAEHRLLTTGNFQSKAVAKNNINQETPTSNGTASAAEDTPDAADTESSPTAAAPPARKIAAQTVATSDSALEKPKPSHYIVVIALASAPGAADSVKAQLAMLGLEARFISNPHGERAQLGPFPSRLEAKQLQQQLAENNLHGSIIGLPNEP